MFEVRRTGFNPGEGFSIYNADEYSCLHSDSSTLSTPEYWPAKELAQKVLDKFYPKPKHEWKHGDVFENSRGSEMLFLKHAISGEVRIYCAFGNCDLNHPNIVEQLRNAKFLFNIKEKI